MSAKGYVACGTWSLKFAMLMVRQGDLFAHLEPECVLAHGCNAQGKMGSGFAAEIRRRYPQAYTAYFTAHLDSPLEVGDMLIVVCEDEAHPGRKHHVANLITQRYYGRNPNVVYVDYDAVKSTLKNVAKYAKINDLPVHFPFIGGGLAGGDRDRLLEIFRAVFMDVDATLWLDPSSSVTKDSSCPSRRFRSSVHKATRLTR